MRRISFAGLLLTTGFIFAATLAAQNPKGPDSKDPKAPEVKTDKNSENKWPTQVAGKKLAEWVKDIRDPTDASTRESALRTVAVFGPEAGKAASANLLHALKEDTDINVRMTAISMVPILGFDKGEYDLGLDHMVGMLKQGSTASSLTKQAVIIALGNCGTNAKRAIPTLVEVSLVDRVSWQNREAAATALGKIGMPIPPLPMPVAVEPGKEPKEPPKEAPKEYAPDAAAIRGLIKGLHDSAHSVRRACVTSLLALGPPDPSEKVYTELREALRQRFKEAKEKDKSVIIWCHVLYMQSETKLTKNDDVNLKELDKFLDERDSELRMEAIQAFGVLGEAAKSRVDRLLSIAVNSETELPVVCTAIWAVSGMKSQQKKSVPVLTGLAKHKDPVVKETAESAIDLLTGRKRELKKEDPKKDEPKKDAVKE